MILQILWKFIFDDVNLDSFDTQLCIMIKAELLQLNRTQFSSLGIFISKKVGNRKKLRPLFIISVLKVVYLVVLVFSISNFFYGLAAVIQL